MSPHRDPYAELVGAFDATAADLLLIVACSIGVIVLVLIAALILLGVL